MLNIAITNNAMTGTVNPRTVFPSLLSLEEEIMNAREAQLVEEV